MLGAQALRTKQKVERKEKEKRHKERVRNAELQRERLQKAASDDSAAAALFDAPQHSTVARQHQRLSVSAVHHHRVATSHEDNGHRTPSPTAISAPVLPPVRSPSTDFVSERVPAHNGHASAGGRLMKFLGLSSNSTLSEQKKEAKRRMSTF